VQKDGPQFFTSFTVDKNTFGVPNILIGYI